MFQKAPILKFGEGLDNRAKCVLHAGAHFLASGIMIGRYRQGRRTEVFLRLLVTQRLGDYIHPRQSFWMEDIGVYRRTERVIY